MRNPVLSVILLFVLFSGTNCIKEKTCSPKTTASEAPEIQAYAATNGIVAIPHSSGLYYEIINPGSGATATANSRIAITYTGKFLDGTVFDERLTPNNTAVDGPWALSLLIEGWRVGIPLIKEGGRIRLLIPSAMAYGCTGYGGIPGNTILDFDITLVNVQ